MSQDNLVAIKFVQHKEKLSIGQRNFRAAAQSSPFCKVSLKYLHD